MRSKFEVPDLSAVLLSGACVAHCAFLPLIAFLAPGMVFVGLSDPAFHLVMFLIAVPLSAVALRRGTLLHRRRMPTAVASAGLLLMLIDLIPVNGVHVHNLTVPGAVLLGLAHLLNMHALRAHAPRVEDPLLAIQGPPDRGAAG